MKKLLILISLLSLSLSTLAADLTGKCIGVSDGDTIKVLIDKKPLKVRLEGIDCPESHQDYGTKAKQYTSSLTFGKQVVLKVSTTDRYGRLVATVFVGDTNVNLSLLQAGFAWHYKAYSSDKRLAKAEEKARELKLGLWQDSNPIPPWEFRRGKKSTAASKKSSAESIEKGYWLNTSSGVRHNSSCKHFNNTKRGRSCSDTEGKSCGICGG